MFVHNNHNYQTGFLQVDMIYIYQYAQLYPAAIFSASVLTPKK